MAEPVTVNDVLDGHVALDLECLDRIYLNTVQMHGEHLWVPQTLRTSCGLLIFVDQSADPVASLDVVDLGCPVGEWA